MNFKIYSFAADKFIYLFIFKSQINFTIEGCTLSQKLGNLHGAALGFFEFEREFV
jgi:hypothetical protein